MKHLVFHAAEHEPLGAQLSRVLEPAVGRPVTGDEVDRLLAQGSVFRDKKRWKDAGAPGPGPAFEIFWPDLPVTEFTLGPERIVWQDEHLLVIDKPPGVNTAPSPFSDIDCLTWGVQKLLGAGFPIHAVHRLDRDTQGLIFFAKHKLAERALHQMFRDRQVRKVYRALTLAHPDRDCPRIFRWRDELDYRGKVQFAATTALHSGTDPLGRDVWTVLPHTGRPHQIRRHFERYWLPLWGDRAYAPGLYGPDEVLGLACVAYRCRHPVTGDRLEIVRTLDAPGENRDKGLYSPPSSSG